jgi:hypothetical protein
VNRRELIGLVGGAAAAWPLGAGAQHLQRMRRIGVNAAEICREHLSVPYALSAGSD